MLVKLAKPEVVNGPETLSAVALILPAVMPPVVKLFVMFKLPANELLPVEVLKNVFARVKLLEIARLPANEFEPVKLLSKVFARPRE